MKKFTSQENVHLIEDFFHQWEESPSAVPEEWQDYFRSALHTDYSEQKPSESTDTAGEGRFAYKQSRVYSLLWAYRDVGYIYAQLNPLKGYMPKELEYMWKTIEGVYESLALKEYDLQEEDLGTVFRSSPHLSPSEAKLSEIIEVLKEAYCSYIGVEILHIQNNPIRKWLIQRIESNNNRPQLSDQRKIMVQKDLIKAQTFEKFLHSRFIGQKRFSVEGGEVVIPALHYLVDTAVENDIDEIVLGMSHRGRLNVLTNIFQKPLSEIFEKFEDSDDTNNYGLSGDVKYHLGYSRDHIHHDGTKTHLSIVANPSHLESVDPVVQGKTRGIQKKRGDASRKHVLPVLIHGDAAFTGQGIVSETFNLSKLKGYETGGTIHIIINNQIGFTTPSRDQRSTFFPTDIAKALPVPIFHVNGDQPEHVIRAIDLAFAYRQKFGYDAIVDIFCYRKYGHNEADEPSFTHPIMYELIENSPGVVNLYGDVLDTSSVFTHDEQEDFRKSYEKELSDSLDKVRNSEVHSKPDGFEEGVWKNFSRKYSHAPVDTTVSRENIEMIARAVTNQPDDFAVHKKLSRIIGRRKEMIEKKETVDWATGEELAFGSLLLDGYPIRLSGEDSGRGTFSQRHAVWWSVTQGRTVSYTPLNHITEKQEYLSVYDSPLSEFSVLGFEFGYSLARPNTLVLWEAQFGDFANGGQVIIDQFIAGSEVKWDRSSGLVMLLPHGYEGQGPEHSSAFLERYLQLCAESNMQVCNPTTPAQYFHLLRRQMLRNFRKPLIIMAPKSLLRHSEAVSTIQDCAEGSFSEILDDAAAPDSPDRIILCSGKIYYDLTKKREELGDTSSAILRLEQLYPLHNDRILETVKKYSRAETVLWVQEETRNRGAWMFLQDNLFPLFDKPVRYIGRPPGGAPAGGSYNQFVREQEDIVTRAFAEK